MVSVLEQAAVSSDRLFDAPAKSLHGVHIDCQPHEYVIAACGYLLDWSERSDQAADPVCDACIAVDHCPVCGAEFEPWDHR